MLGGYERTVPALRLGTHLYCYEGFHCIFKHIFAEMASSEPSKVMIAHGEDVMHVTTGTKRSLQTS